MSALATKPVGLHRETETGRDEFLRDFVAGMRSAPKRIPSKYLYDARGSQLFEEITRLPEYYLTRVETDILSERAGDIGRLAGPRCALIELGSGSSEKTRMLLDRLQEPTAYVPVDISEAALERAAQSLARRYPVLDILPVYGDFSQPEWSLPCFAHEPTRMLFFFPGSTIGNFTPDEAPRFLKNVRQHCRPGDVLLIGVDLVKDKTVLEAAYNDSSGITAQFNLNVLQRANRELGVDFVMENFQHRAPFNSACSRIEMQLVSSCAQHIHVGAECFTLEAGEAITTEYSHKYTTDAFRRLGHDAGFTPAVEWADRAHYLGVFWLVAY